MYRFYILFLLCFSPALLLAQSSSSEIEDLRKQVTAQQHRLEEQQRVLDRLSGSSISQPQSTQAEGKDQTKAGSQAISPLSFRIGGAEFTPSGFIDMTSIWRSTNVGSGVATSFGAIPANNSTAGRLSEWRFSATNSRLILKVAESPMKDVQATGYLEMDFAGALPSNAYVTGNSLSFRLRQGFIGVQKGKFEIIGGQAWSLMTPNRRGVSPVPSELFLGMQQDSAYLAGLVWARQAQVRLTYKISPHWALAFSAENPEQYVTTATTLPASFSSQFDTNSGVNTIANARPDLAAKLAFDTKLGKRAMHMEIAGLSRQFRTLTPDNIEHSAQGLGGSFNLVIEPAKNLKWVFTSFFSNGGGRYILGLGPDLIVAPNGSISLVHATSGITGLEYQIHPSAQVFAYYSGAYFSRNYAMVSSNGYLGFGYPGSSNSANRQIQEATAGYMHTFWKNPNFGALQAVGQYSYVTRSPWYMAPATNSDMHSHIVFTALRFTLP